MNNLQKRDDKVLIHKEIYICDRCEKELEKKEVKQKFDGYHQYELCSECADIYEKYKEEIKTVEQKVDNINKNFKFGKYTPAYLNNERWY